MRIKEMIANSRRSWLLDKSSPKVPGQINREQYGELAYWCKDVENQPVDLFSFCSISEGERSSPEETARPLKFESRFESGNLRKAIQVVIVILGASVVKLEILSMCDVLAFQLWIIHDSTRQYPRHCNAPGLWDRAYWRGILIRACFFWGGLPGFNIN